VQVTASLSKLFVEQFERNTALRFFDKLDGKSALK
jgi:hypothetical protein